MPKIIYANLVWFIIIFTGAVIGSVNRHSSPTWDTIPDVRLNYDLMFVGVFGLILLISLIGIYKKRSWGYNSAMFFNYILVTFSVTPIIGMLIYAFINDFTISNLMEIDWSFTSAGFFTSAISIVFVVYMRKSHVKSIFKNT